ncbi:MAG TPA: hypothetical protein PKM67_01035 [Kiritimatiellia bacterium]|nr:hypothetical protein [Kiritimatiellia bacterium]HNS80027.1 hypothetical protein [Kiritimatiellia bacterium]HPA77969.1 hypothetical protein [Kiritimatiellia bacterium]
MKFARLIVSIVFPVFLTFPSAGQVPEVINYQGRIQVQGTNFTGTGLFKFAIGTEGMGTVYWSNDGTLGGEPAAGIEANLDKGLFSLGLGDTKITGMAALNPGILAGTDLWIRVWFSDGVLGYEQISPDQQIQSVPYALLAAGVSSLAGHDVTELDDVSDAGSGMIITADERNQIAFNQDGIAALSTNLADEISGRVAADASLAGDLAAASNALNARVTQNTDDISASYSLITNNAGRITALDTAKVNRAGDTMTGALNISSAADAGDLVIGSTGTAVSIGRSASGTGSGTAVGRGANGSGYGAGIGLYADGSENGAAAGYSAKGGWHGAAVGAQANGSFYGVAAGRQANGSMAGTAVGYDANAFDRGTALGFGARAMVGGIAIGPGSFGILTNIAIGTDAWAGGIQRITIGNEIQNEVDNSIAVRGSLYLDGGEAVYYRPGAGTGTWVNLLENTATGTPLYVYTETDPVWDAEKAGYATGTPLYVYSETDPVYASEKSGLATGTPVYAESDPVWESEKSGYATGTPIYVEADPVWAAEKAGYATGTPLYVYSETDPVYASEKSGLATGTPVYAETDPVWIAEKGAYATGTPVYTETDPVWAAEKSSYATGTPLYVYTESDPNAVLADGSRAMDGDLDMGGNSITNFSTNSIFFADGTAMGVTDVQNWNSAYGWGDHSAAGYATGTPLYAQSETDPLAVLADGSRPMSGRLDMGGNGITNVNFIAFDTNVQVGDGAQSFSSLGGSVAIGKDATARYRTSGLAIGTEADGDYNGIAIGYQADGQYSNIAVGFQSSAYSGYDRIAIGCKITNRVNNSCAIRGTLYLDGGTGVMVRSSVGTGAWSAKAFTIDHPLDPENMVLRHFCLEGPEVLNVYNGNAVLDDAGETVITLPDYFEAINRDPRYALTPIGAKMDLYIKQEISDNRFIVAGGAPGGKVSWEVKALRSDPALLEDIRRRPVEQPKSELTPDQMVQENETVNTFP